MKQKRKVKSLLSQKKDLNGGLMTALLLALGLALCLGSATLMTTSSVGAAGIGQPLSSLSYSGLDDKVEVLYNLQFSDPARLSGFVGEMYTDKNNDFYITSTPLVVNLEDTSTYKNEVDTGLYSNILGGYNNKVKSKNITIIGGSDNSIASPNNNAVIFGGDLDKIIGSSAGSTPSVIVGGYNNEIHNNHDGDVIIGGESNKILGGVSNSFILGGKNNTVSTNNVIVGGSNVTGNVGDIFAFSNSSSFTPQDSNAFYLNLVGGVGINTGSAGIGVTVNGPVKFGEIDITNTTQYPCNSDNYGMIGVWSVGGIGCLVGCTASSAGDGNKWDLLDRGEMCQNLCESGAYNGYCSQIKPEIIEEPVHYNSFCTTGDTEKVDVSNASPCTPVWDKIENVVFETSLIDAKPEANCPANAANKCIYQCNSGYHLTGDTTGKFPNNNKIEKCFRDCDLKIILGPDWAATGNNGVIKHNQTVIAYNKEVVPCSYDAYSYNPITRTNGANPSGYNNSLGYFLDNGYGTKRYRNFTGMDTKRIYELPETCTNNAHQQRLVCVNGSMYITMSGGSVKATTILATLGGSFRDAYLGYAHSGYIHMDCHTSAYTCNTGQYDLTEAYINTGLFDEITTSPKDRKTLNGTRGTYKLCLDYIQDPSNNKECRVNVSKAGGNAGSYDMHYEFKGCREGSGYHPTERPGDDNRVCRKECKLTTNDSVSVTKRDQYEITLYNVSEGSCLAIDNGGVKHCESKTFKCDDGTWRDLSGNAVTTNDIRTTFGYSKCLQKGNACDGYNVSTGTYNRRHSIGDNISHYTEACHKMHAYVPYPAPTEGPWNKVYRDNTGAKVHDFGIPSSIKRACEDNDRWRKLDGCNDLCYHANSLDTSIMNEYMQYCVKDIKDEDECSDNSNYIKAGKVYTLWEGVWNSGSWGYGDCTYYCPKDTYDNGSQCVDNPICEFPSYDADTEFVVTSDPVTMVGGYKNYYIVKNKETGDELRRSDACIHCNEGYGVAYYHQEGNSCKRNQHSCEGDLPYYSSHGSSTTYDGSIKEWTYKPSGTLNACEFRCKTNYVWDGYTCIEKECGEPTNLCTITYAAGEGTPSKESDTVVCGTWVTLADASWNCHDFTAWYDGGTKIGKKGEKYKLTSSITVSPDWSYDVGQCPYQCVGSEYPAGGTTIEINSDPGNNTGLNWQFISGYNVTLGPCQWSCKRGYMRGTGTNIHTCVEKPCQTDSSHVKPTGNSTVVRKYGNKDTYVGLDIKWTYKGTTTQNATQPNNTTPTLDQCEWTCQPGYTRSGSTCIKRTCYTSSAATARSTTLVPTIAHSKQGTGLFVSTSNLYWIGVSGSNPGPCEWVCESGYTRLKTSAGCQNTCVPIHNGKCMSDGTKRVKDNVSGYCSTGYASAIRSSLSNKYEWDCISNNSGSVCYPDDPGRVGSTAQNCYRCKSGYTGSACGEIRNASCDNSVEKGCKYTGVTAQTSDTSGKVDYQDDTTIYWHCEGKNGGAEANGCKKCKSGYSRNGSACVKCQGTMPSEASLNTTTLPNNNTTYYTCNPSSTAACTYTCPSGKVCDGTNGCRNEDYGECDTSEPYSCINTSNRVEKTDTTSDNQWKRYCRGLDGKSSLCTKSCEDGENLDWTSEHNGTCETSCPAPTITSVEGNKVYYSYDTTANASAMMTLVTQNTSNWPTVGSVGGRTDSYKTVSGWGWVKLKLQCRKSDNSVVWSDDSNIMEYGSLCGSAADEGKSYTSAPSSNLCATGTTASAVTTGTDKYTWTCSTGSRSENCEAGKRDFTDVEICGSEPVNVKYRGTIPDYISSVQYNGSKYWLNYDCQCDRTSKKWKCSKQEGNFNFGGIKAAYGSYSFSQFDYYNGITKYEGAGNYSDGNYGGNYGTCSTSVYNYFMGLDDNITIGTTNGSFHDNHGAVACGYECNTAYGGPCNKSSCWMAFSCSQEAPNSSRFRCGPKVYVTCYAVDV